jgi:hypothetical protein
MEDQRKAGFWRCLIKLWTPGAVTNALPLSAHESHASSQKLPKETAIFPSEMYIHKYMVSGIYIYIHKYYHILSYFLPKILIFPCVPKIFDVSASWAPQQDDLNGGQRSRNSANTTVLVVYPHYIPWKHRIIEYLIYIPFISHNRW